MDAEARLAGLQAQAAAELEVAHNAQRQAQEAQSRREEAEQAAAEVRLSGGRRPSGCLAWGDGRGVALPPSPPCPSPLPLAAGGGQAG